jgi:hypothetical protein
MSNRKQSVKFNLEKEDINMAKTQKGQNLYNKMLVTQIINYQKLGYENIKINNENYSNGQPNKVCGYTPDLSADLDDETILCEVVTDETIDEIGMIERWKALSRYTNNFQMIILKKSFTRIKELAKSNGINVNKYWYSKICNY